MNCLEFRKQQLSAIGPLDAEASAHAASCRACAAFARELSALNEKLRETMHVPLPDTLAEKILLTQRRDSRRSRWTPWAIAASIIIATVITTVGIRQEPPETAERVTDAAIMADKEIAIAAVAYVVEHEPKLLAQNVQGDPAVMHTNLQRLGLHLPAGASVRYLGKCPVAGGTGDHLVVQTDTEAVTLILVTEPALGPRVMVAHRKKTAVASSLRQGGYILIGDSIAAVRRLEQTLI